MANFLSKALLSFSLISLSFSSLAQCPVITCPGNIVSNNDAGMCDAVVTYSLPSATDPCAPATSQTFNYTGAQQLFTVPAGVTSVTVEAYGAQGGANNPMNTNYGGFVQADITVIPGTTIYVYVGGQPTTLTGGWNGGGNGETGGIGGGGASDIRIGGTALTDRMIVAGAAGGGGFWSGQEIFGGLGGGLVGGTGYRNTIADIGGDPGTQTSSGNGTCSSFNNPICTGGFGYGGAPSGCGCEGYGGGGGWYGGAGSGNCRGGGGGSSYTDPSATNVTHTQGIRAGHGEVTISWVGSTTPPTITQIAGLASGSVFPVGTTINTFVANSLGGADTCSFNVTVFDVEDPGITCPGNIEVCEGTPLSGAAAATVDNCAGESVSFSLTGATTGSGIPDVNGMTFNFGTTNVTYTVIDLAGNQGFCSFNVVTNPLPTVALSAFPSDTVCNYTQPIPLPLGTPAAGTYSGNGVSGTNFDPASAVPGYNWIIYTYTDPSGCSNSDTVTIYVDGCASLNETFLSTNFYVYPNPTEGQVNVSLGSFDGAVDYTITTLDGRIIDNELNHVGPNIAVDLSRERNGIYLILIKSDFGNRTLKIVKE